MYDTIIIGSGLGGLECGVLLSKAGHKVLILEQGTQPGGCLQSYHRREHAYDTGFHYVGGLAEGQSLHDAFHCLGLLDLPWQKLDADAFDIVTIAGKSFRLAEGYDNFVNQLAESFPNERQGLEDYARRLKNTDSMDVEMSAWEYLNTTFHDELLINILSGTCLKMELRKESLPLFTFLHANSGYIESSWRLRGDGNLIVTRLIEQIKQAGGNVICNAKVISLTGKDKIEKAICADGREFEADTFISDIHPAITCDLLKDTGMLKKSYIHRMQRTENTFGMFTVSLLYNSGVIPYFNHNHYIYRQPNVWDFYEHQQTEIGGVMVSCRVPEDESDFARQIDILTPMPLDMLEAWKDTAIGHRGDAYKQLKENFADRCIELAAEQLPTIKNYTERYTSTPLSWRDYTLTPNGTAYGMRKDYRNSASALLSPRTPVANLLMTGQSLMLHGIHGTTMTAFLTCEEVLGKETVWQMLKNDM